MIKKLIILVILLVGSFTLVQASEVTGTLSTGISGTVNELTGTVITPPVTSGGGSSGGGGGGYVAVPVKIVATSTATTTKPLVLGVSTFRFTKVLRFGQQSNNIKELQKRLKTEGVYKGPITGYFGNLTKIALKLYQKKNKLTPSGILNKPTITKLNQ